MTKIMFALYFILTFFTSFSKMINAEAEIKWTN